MQISITYNIEYTLKLYISTSNKKYISTQSKIIYMIKITYFNQACIKGHLYLTNLCFHKDDLFFPFNEKYK